MNSIIYSFCLRSQFHLQINLQEKSSLAAMPLRCAERLSCSGALSLFRGYAASEGAAFGNLKSAVGKPQAFLTSKRHSRTLSKKLQ